ncbi:MAG: BatD family protein [Verrucomicrobiota bacterium]|nr:BatD family protein [Verrucomicrobiota bacterium]
MKLIVHWISKFFAGGCLIFLITLSTFAANTSIKVSISIQEITLDDGAEIQVEVEGGASQDKVQAPTVPELNIQHIGTSSASSITIINGAISNQQKIILKFLVKASKPGSYTIPPFTFTADGKTIESNTVTLNVAKGTGRKRIAEKTQALVNITVPDEKVIYVGQKVLAEVKLIVSGQQMTRAEPILKANDFLLSPFSTEPVIAPEIINGESVTSYRWYVPITPLKSGSFPLSATIQGGIAVLSSTGNSFMDQFIGQQSFEQGVQIESSESTVEALPLPTEKQPPGFKGAIGTFDALVAATKESDFKVGEPFTLTVELSGKGNMERIDKLEFPPNPGFKVFLGKVRFEQASDAFLKGKKIFEITLIPQSTSVAQIPALALDYFNPATGSYQSVKSNPISLKVAKGSSGQTSVAAPIPEIEATTSVTLPQAANFSELGSMVTLSDPWSESGFAFLHALPLLLLAIAGIIKWRANSRPQALDRNALREQAKQLKTDKAAAIQAADAGQRREFFIMSRNTIRNKIGTMLKLPGSVVTSYEVAQSNLFDEELKTRVVKYLEACDEEAFGVTSQQNIPLSVWKDSFVSLMSQLDATL